MTCPSCDEPVAYLYRGHDARLEESGSDLVAGVTDAFFELPVVDASDGTVTDTGDMERYDAVHVLACIDCGTLYLVTERDHDDV